ncbi:MAG: DctP family TRAP transporter solute-binding subunit [Spirochaetes bacterium]|nr:DctP family TRAP transporter solute-binding subunit [Spirochaetota bacterium]
MKRLGILFLLVSLVTGFVLAGGKAESKKVEVQKATAAGAIELKLAHADSTDITISRKHAQAVAFAELVNARSGGRINVKVYGAGSLGAEREYTEAIKAGTIEAGIPSGVVANFFPSAMVTDIPYLFPSAEVAWRVLDGPFGKKLMEMFKKETGMRALGLAEVGFRHFTSATKQIKTPDDLKGMKIRVMETPLYINMMKGLGANPTPIAWTEVYTAMQTKVVDGHENVIPSIVFAKLYEVQKYLTLDGHTYGVDWFIINENFFKNKLSPELQYIVLDSARISCGVGRGVNQLITVMATKELQDKGMQIYTPTEKEIQLFKEATQKPVLDWMKTRVDPALIDEAMKAVAEVVNAQKKEL